MQGVWPSRPSRPSSKRTLLAALPSLFAIPGPASSPNSRSTRPNALIEPRKMTTGQLEELVAAALAKPEGPALQRLLHALGSDGKENSGAGGKAARAAALQCFKQAQARLAEAGASGSSAAAYATLASAALAALEAQSPAGTAAAAQLLPLRYNYVKRLVAARRYDAAWREAATLHAQLGAGASGGGGGAQRTPEAAAIAVGAVLMLLLCCVEGGPAADGPQLAPSVEAARALGPWLE